VMFVMLVGRIWLGSLFIYSGFMKLGSYRESRGFLAGYGLFPRWFANTGGLLIPWIELLIGGLLLVNRTQVIGSILAATAAFGFAVIGAVTLHRHLQVSCGCAGVASSDRIDVLTIIRALVMFTAAILIPFTNSTNIQSLGILVIALVAAAPAVLLTLRRNRYRRWLTTFRALQNANIEELTALLETQAPGSS